jgi:hypothetical protein
LKVLFSHLFPWPFFSDPLPVFSKSLVTV